MINDFKKVMEFITIHDMVLVRIRRRCLEDALRCWNDKRKNFKGCRKWKMYQFGIRRSWQHSTSWTMLPLEQFRPITEFAILFRIHASWFSRAFISTCSNHRSQHISRSVSVRHTWRPIGLYDQPASLCFRCALLLLLFSKKSKYFACSYVPINFHCIKLIILNINPYNISYYLLHKRIDCSWKNLVFNRLFTQCIKINNNFSKYTLTFEVFCIAGYFDL